MKKTRKLTRTKTQAVTNFASRFKLDSFGSSGRCCGWSTDRLRLLVILRANAGKARDCVKVSLCNDSDSE